MAKQRAKKTRLPRVIEFHDEKNDEFSTAVITPRRIDGHYNYERTEGFRKIIHLFWYRVVLSR